MTASMAKHHRNLIVECTGSLDRPADSLQPRGAESGEIPIGASAFMGRARAPTRVSMAAVRAVTESVARQHRNLASECPGSIIVRGPAPPSKDQATQATEFEGSMGRP